MPELTSSHSTFNWRRATPFALAAALVGVVIVTYSFAAGPLAAFEPELGTLSGGATQVTVSGASGGKAVQFIAAATPTPTPTPTATPGTGFCASFPALPAAKPDATNTGVPAGTSLTASGDITVTTAGAVINAKDVTGSISVNANNVTIQNSKVHSSGGSSYKGIDIGNVTGTKIINSEVYTTNGGYIGIDAANTTVCGSYIHGFENAMTVGGGMMVQANYIDKLQSGQSGPHYDGIEVYYGGNSKYWGNNIRLTTTSGAWHNETNAINDTAYNTNIGTVEINGNWLGGGTYTLGIRESDGFHNTNIKVTNNRWYRGSYFYGTHDVQPDSAVTTWSGNVFDDNGQTIAE